MIFDMHCHVDLIEPMDKFCTPIKAHDLTVLAMTTTPKAYEIELRLLKRYPTIYLALGLHPQLALERKNELPLFDNNISTSRYIGEIGLDFSKRFYQSKHEQEYIFEHIIETCTHSKTISIHAVYSAKNVLDILEKYYATQRNNCILHWYSGSLKQLDRAVEYGCYFSINEHMLRSKNGQNIIERIPIKQILLESDAPFVGNIVTASQLYKSLSCVVDGLCSIKQIDVRPQIEQNSRKVLGCN